MKQLHSLIFAAGAIFLAADKGGGDGAAEPATGKASKAPKEKPKLIKVRLVGTQPLLEDGELRQPKRQEPNGKGGMNNLLADIFEVTEERAEALGALVEVVE